MVFSVVTVKGQYDDQMVVEFESGAVKTSSGMYCGLSSVFRTRKTPISADFTVQTVGGQNCCTAQWPCCSLKFPEVITPDWLVGFS